jgi:hypothetical protein
MLSWQQGALLTLGIAVAVIAAKIIQGRRGDAAGAAGKLTAFLAEAGTIAGLYTIWQLVGALSLTHTANAVDRATAIAHFERTLHLPPERSVQDLILGRRWLVETANLYYAGLHFAMMFVFLLWLYLRHRDRYPAVRTTLAAATLACLAIQSIPVAPPRLLDGYVDTAASYGQSVYGQGGVGADQLSAMPSVHVMWAVLIGWYVVRIGRSRWRFLALLYPVLTMFVVVSTGNHWWLDGIVGVAVLIACAWVHIGLVHAWRALRSVAHPAARPSIEPVAVPAGIGSMQWSPQSDRH